MVPLLQLVLFNVKNGFSMLMIPRNSRSLYAIVSVALLCLAGGVWQRLFFHQPEQHTEILDKPLSPPPWGSGFNPDFATFWLGSVDLVASGPISVGEVSFKEKIANQHFSYRLSLDPSFEPGWVLRVEYENGRWQFWRKKAIELPRPGSNYQLFHSYLTEESVSQFHACLVEIDALYSMNWESPKPDADDFTFEVAGAGGYALLHWLRSSRNDVHRALFACFETLPSTEFPSRSQSFTRDLWGSCEP